MKPIFFLLAIAMLFSGTVPAQKPEYSTVLIPPALKENANAVIRSNEQEISILSQDRMVSVLRTAITILNEQGLRHLDISENYDKRNKISKIEARVFDALGNEIKVYKRKDFSDVSVGDGFSVFVDNRLLYVKHTAVSYPFTVLFEREIVSSNTAFISPWYPVRGYFISTEKDMLTMNYAPDLGFGFNEQNFNEKFNITKQESVGKLSYTASNIKAVKAEDSSPDFSKLAPVAYFKVEKFSLEGVSGQASDWKDFGKWYYDNLLYDTAELSEETKQRVRKLVGSEDDPVKIARIIYQYVQDKTRYVSIQIGIGGFKPMYASDVDKLGYGDCKALTNYTRALLNVVGVPSYFTLVYAGGTSPKGFRTDIVTMQGNHAILTVPVDDNYIWLECTSQISPFGFQGRFTDGREVLMVKPGGGEIVKTKSSINKDNRQTTKGTYSIGADGTISGNLSIVSTGSQYDETYHRERQSGEDREEHYKNYFRNISRLKINALTFNNDKDSIQFTQNIAISAPVYAEPVANSLLFAINAFNQYGQTPKRYRNRESPFQISRGFFDEDEIEVNLPEGYGIESLPAVCEIKGKYGEYHSEVIKKTDKVLVYRRSLLIKDGFYPNTEYEEYRQFREQVARNDNAKVVLLKL